MTISLDITGKIDPATIELLRTVSRAIETLGMPYVIVGATARDLVMHHAHGAAIERATRDVDFAIKIADWGAFDAIRNQLAKVGFELTRAQHRLHGPAGAIVDIVPFGLVADKTASIAWPPDGKVVMNVLGFQEACDNAERVRIAQEPELIIPVATPAGMALLKLIAWSDRIRETRSKDAQDFAYLLQSYERIPVVTEMLFSEEWAPIMDGYGWDLTLAAAHKLGHDAGRIAKEPTRHEIERIVSDEAKREQLIIEMSSYSRSVEFEKNNRLLAAFAAGIGPDINR